MADHQLPLDHLQIEPLSTQYMYFLPGAIKILPSGEKANRLKKDDIVSSWNIRAALI